MSLEDLYKEVLFEHYKSPRNFGKLDDAQLEVHLHNPNCGDDINLQLIIGEDNRVAEVKFDGKGCVVSQASASMMTEAIEGKTIAEVYDFIESFQAFITNHGEIKVELEDLEALEGVKKYPIRVKCAMLAWNALNQILEKAKSNNKE